MAKVLLAFDDVGMGIQLQEELEKAGHVVQWDGAQRHGPGERAIWAEAVLVTAAEGPQELEQCVQAWHDADPPPALLIIATNAAEQQAASDVRVPAVLSTSSRAAVSDAIDAAIETRYAGGLDATSPLKVGLRAVGLTVEGSELDMSIRLIGAARKAEVNMVRAALRWHATKYALVSPDWISGLREHRALTIPEVEFSALLDGTHALQSAIRAGGMEPWQAARFAWALASIGALLLTEDPADQATSRRRRLHQTRFHLRKRTARLKNSTYYDVLEVTIDATQQQLDHSVQMLAVRYSPDKLERMDLSTLTPLVEPIWAKVREAHGVLSSMADRGRYNNWLLEQTGLQSQWNSREINTGNAAQMMARGQAALVDGQLFKAVSDMAAACRLHPHHPDYEASLAWARFRSDSSRDTSRRTEIAERERTIATEALAGRRPWPRALLALGLLCVAHGDAEAARWHLHEALTCDPELPAARQLLKRIGGARRPTES